MLLLNSKCLPHPSTQKSRGSSDVSPRFAHTILTFAVTFLEQKTTVDSLHAPWSFQSAARFCSLSGSALRRLPSSPLASPCPSCSPHPSGLWAALPRPQPPLSLNHPQRFAVFTTGKLLKILCRNPTYKMAGNEMTLRMR